MSAPNKYTAEIVRTLRDQLKLSPRELADTLGMGKRGVSLVHKWEQGKAIPSAAALTAIRLLVRIEHLEDALGLGTTPIRAISRDSDRGSAETAR